MKWTREEVVAAYEEHKTVRSTADALGIDRTGLRKRLRGYGVLRAEAGPLLEPASGQILKGTSTLVRGDGTVVQQWVKISVEHQDRLAAFESAIKALAVNLEPVPTVQAPRYTAEDLMVAIPIGDPHIGLLAWGAESGADWDLKIAERVFTTAIEQAVLLAPPAAECLLINLGDYFHTDSQANTTSRSGHQLDVDSRWAKMLEVGIRIQRRMVELCLQKFGRVTVDNVRGNHDDHSAIMLSHVMRAYFANETRVLIDDSPALHRYHEFGKCLIGTHHGHTTKSAQLAMLMAASNPEAWGRTKHRRVYCGHVHHDSLKEEAGVIVETVNTLAARDAYAAGAGYLSGRDLKLDTWHREHGMVNRSIIGIERIERGK